MPPKFTPRARKQKAKRAEAALREQAVSAVGNRAGPEEKQATTLELEARKQRIREEIEAQRLATSRTSSKKRKRLEKYVDGKLRKEENAELIKKLAQQQQGVDTSLLKSSKKLGRVTEHRREAAGRALREQRAGLTSVDDGILFQRAGPSEEPEYASDTSEDVPGHKSQARAATQSKPVQTPSFGAGLKTPLELDADGNPIIKMRQRKKRRIASYASQEDDDWEGFSDDDGSVPLASDPSGFEDDESDASTAGTGATRSSEGSEGEEAETESSDEDDSSGDEESKRTAKEAQAARKSAFELFATEQRNRASGFTPSNAIFDMPKDIAGETTVYRNKTQPVGLPSIPITKQVHSVEVDRTQEVQDTRSKLPVVAAEQPIMEAIRNKDIVIIDGETGSGKTTQVPQFLFEGGYGDRSGPTPGMIGVTQPRRVAAVSMAKRVALELNDRDGRVSHQIRFDSTVSSKTAIKFMTDGVLLREVSEDFMLTKYSAIVIDEAHERSVNTDILIGMLSRIVITRSKYAATNSDRYKPLKLVIMSATLRVHDFTSNKVLFPHEVPPVIRAEGRAHDVTVHWARRTQRDYVDEAFHKISKGHRKLPPGGMLVFLTGQAEIVQLAKRLRGAFPSTSSAPVNTPKVAVSAATSTIEDEDLNIGKRIPQEDEDGFDSDIELRGLDDPEEDKDFEIEEGQTCELLKVHILPLYSQLPTEQQMQVFAPAPDGSRAIVLATNIAETSLTIPGIRYVFDCGRAKEKNFDRQTGVQTFDVGWISKAAAQQRKGRAGRTGPGHCYRLYSSAVYERDFAEYSAPEIERSPIEGVVLQLKSMGIPQIGNFPFPTPPDLETLLKAEKLLEFMGALKEGKVTSTGEQIAVYPLSPRLARIIVMSQHYDCLQHALAMVAALAVQEIFVTEAQLQLNRRSDEDDDNDDDEFDVAAKDSLGKAFNNFHGNAARLDRHSDAIKLLTAFSDYIKDQSKSKPIDERFLRLKALEEALQLRNQLSWIVAAHKPGSMTVATNSTHVPATSAQQVKILRQIVAAGYIDQVAVRADKAPNAPELFRKPRRTIEVPYITLFPSYDEAEVDARMRAEDAEGQRRTSQEKFVFIHPSSVLAHISMEKLPQFIVYSHLSRATPSTVAGMKAPRTRMHPLTPVSAAQIAALAEGTPLIEEGKPVGRIESLPREDGHERRMCWVVPYLKGPAGSIGWALPPAKKVMQRRIDRKGWIVEKVIEEGKT